jgi:hypothetical protein
MMKALVSVSVLLLVACESSPIHRVDSGTIGKDSGTKESESCGDVQTDNNNCGQCGNVCTAIEPATAQCVKGRCLTALVHQDLVPRLVVAGTGVHWLNFSGIWRTGLRGGTPTILTTQCGKCSNVAGSTSPQCTPLNADATNLYCSNASTDECEDDLFKVPLDGSGQPTFVAKSGWCGISELAIDGPYAYWSQCYKSSAVARAPLAGDAELTELTDYVPGCPANLVPHDSHVYWIHDQYGVDDDTLMKTPKTAKWASSTTLLKWKKGWGRFVVGDAAIYWTDTDRGALMALPLDGGDLPSTISEGLDLPRDLAIDAGHLYWASTDGGTIMRLTLADGALTTLATGQSRPHGIVVDDQSVYWIATDSGQDTVMKLSPK